MNKAKVSIIIPAKNEEKYLPRLLESIKRQTVQPYEIIVADAGSTDRTVEIAKNYGAKVIKGGMPQVGRNNGAKQAKTDIIIFLDADVVLSNSVTLEVLYKFMQQAIIRYASIDYTDRASYSNSKNTKRNKRIPALVAPIPIKHTDYEKVYGEIKRIKKNHILYLGNVMIQLLKQLANIVGNYGINLLVLLNSTYIVTGQIICTKEAFNQLNGFNEKIRLGDDVDFVRRARRQGMFLGWAPVYVEVSDRRNQRIQHLFLAPFLFVGGLLIELIIWLTGRYSIFIGGWIRLWLLFTDN